MRSMTGYGRGEAHQDGLKFTVELNSVNRKQADILVDLPRELIELEPRIRDEINAAISRGRVNAVVAFHRADGAKASDVRLDEPLAKAYLRGMQRLSRDLSVDGRVTLDTLLRCPGVLKLAEKEISPETAWPLIAKTLRQALDRLLRMRDKEGRHLGSDLLKRVNLLLKGVEKIGRLAPTLTEHYRKQLHERIRQAGIDISTDDERLTKEIAFFADRSDITEELTRLKSHLAQFRENLKSREPVGRTLDFLSQEINREINTIASKANHAGICQEVVQLKSELERIREQIQNIE